MKQRHQPNSPNSSLRERASQEGSEQLTLGVPTNADEAGLRRLAAQLKTGKVVVKLYLRHLLHARLYLFHRADRINPIVGYLGSSNLTFAGLSHQGELNVDILDYDACLKLSQWFDDRWNDRWCLDISKELITIIEESWAREIPLSPYHIYLKMAYHLSKEARAGLAEFTIPRDFGDQLFDFQKAAVKIAAHHLNKRGGVLIDESHNLRNREGKRYKAIQDYIEKNESKVILLSATPTTKSIPIFQTSSASLFPKIKTSVFVLNASWASAAPTSLNAGK